MTAEDIDRVISQPIRELAFHGKKVRRILDERLGAHAVLAHFIEKRLTKPAFRKRQKQRPDVPGQTERQPQHLPLRATEEWRRRQVCNVHPCTSFRAAGSEALESRFLRRFSKFP